ncbi:MAG: type II toxin-antitoxin system VapC family toxin [Pirellulales bacterium]
MKKRVYIETSIPSYLAARPARDLIQAARQQITHDWWEAQRGKYDLWTSQLVLDEVGDGDPTAASRRVAFLDKLPILQTTSDVESLAAAILWDGILPPKALRDAVHIALCAVHRVDVLLTWNCRHIANAAIVKQLGAVTTKLGYELPILCTPEELIEDPFDERD